MSVMLHLFCFILQVTASQGLLGSDELFRKTTPTLWETDAKAGESGQLQGEWERVQMVWDIEQARASG